MDSLKKSTYFRPVQVSDNQGKEDYIWAINLNRKVLKFLGLWLYPNATFWKPIGPTLRILWISVCILVINIIPQTLALLKVWGNLTLTVDNLIINIPVTTAQFKLLIPWFKRQALANIFKDIERDWLEVQIQSERNVMIKYATVGKLVTICGLSFGYFSIIFYISPIFFGIVLRTVNNLTDRDVRILPLQTIYFYDITSNNCYYITLISQVLCSALSATIYTSMDVLFGVFVLHACGQLKILAKNIETMGDNNNNNNNQYILKIHVQKHYRLIRFADQIEEVFNLMLLALFASVIITLCVLEFSLITVLSGNSADISMMHIIFDLQFMFTFIFLMFIYSWVGESLATQSDAIYTAVCNCQWINCNPRESTQLILLLIRAQYPLLITAGKLAPIRLPTFVTILKTSMGYASFLRAVKE